MPDAILRYYQRLRDAHAIDAGLVIVSGTPSDRLLGLDPLLDQAKDCAILDIGCYAGAVSEAFARCGARLVHGVDFYRPGLEEARTRFQAYGAEARFERCDLSGGLPALKAALPDLRATYDVVLYLGVHHHLKRQMTSEAMDAFLADIQSRTQYFAVRTTIDLLNELHGGLVGRGFNLWKETDPAPRPLSPLRIYRRQ